MTEATPAPEPEEPVEEPEKTSEPEPGETVSEEPTVSTSAVQDPGTAPMLGAEGGSAHAGPDAVAAVTQPAEPTAPPAEEATEEETEEAAE